MKKTLSFVLVLRALKKAKANSQIREGEPRRPPDAQMSIFVPRVPRVILSRFITHGPVARVSPPTTSGEVSRPLWTKSDVLTLPRRLFRPKTIILSPFLTLEKSVCAGAFENRTCCRHDEYAKLSRRRETVTPPRYLHYAPGELVRSAKSQNHRVCGVLEWSP